MLQTAVEIGAKIAQARKLKSLSQTNLAGQMSVTSQAVGKWERGESMPDIITFGKLASVLGVDLNYFGETFSKSQPYVAVESASIETEKEKADSNNGRDMSSGVWKEADFSGLTGLAKRFKSNHQECLAQASSPMASINSSIYIGYKVFISTLPTGKENLALLTATPSRLPATII